MPPTDSERYGVICAPLIAGAALPALGPGEPNSAVYEQLKNLSSKSIAAGPIADSEMADCCISGLWLLHGYLDESHSLSQNIPTASGSYWHGLMHRREPDFPNAKYWFRQVDRHPIYPDLHAAVQEMQRDSQLQDCVFLAEQTQWDPFRFIDLCENSIGQQGQQEELCRRIAELEWHLLFAYCFGKMHSPR